MIPRRRITVLKRRLGDFGGWISDFGLGGCLMRGCSEVENYRIDETFEIFPLKID